MDPNRWKQIDELVDAALEIPEAEREAFIASRAAGDDDLKRAVTELIGAQSKTNEFLDESAMRIVAKAMAVDEPREKRESLVGKNIATYRIEKLIGAGGMGEVYLAFDEKLRRSVALKILPAEYGNNDERVRRFELEARAISKINHPNIVTIYDVGNANGIYYIATEFVEGKTLRDLSAGRFKLRNVMANSIQICDALSAAHAEGIIHRDIKPENVMIRKDGYAKILDFGVAKLSDVGSETMSQIGGNTLKGVMIGTPAYMSPAQISGDDIDHRTDIWSCGVVLYEFLTGKNPFKGSSRQETFEAILSRKPPPPSSINPEVPPEVDAIVEKIFSRDEGSSYATASDLRADLKQIKRELDSSASMSGEFGPTRTQLNRVSRFRQLIFGGLGAAICIGIAVAAYFLLLRPAIVIKGTDWAAAKSIQLTNQAGTEYFPSLSPDGKDIVYAAEENDSFDIFLLRVGSRKPRNLTADSKSDDTMPAFSPNGETIAFRSEREAKGIYTMDISGDNPRRVADFGFHPSWSPDGKQIVVSTFGRDQPTIRAGAHEGLFVIDVQSGAKREILAAEATFPSWSPNNKRIAYWFYTGSFSRRDIATIPVGGGEPVVIAENFAVSNWNPVWSPDGKYLYFVSNRGGNMNFWRVAIDETSGRAVGAPEPIVTPSTFSRHLTFSRDGKRMAYVQTNNTSNIQGANFDMRSLKAVGEPFWITEGDREIVRPELSADGTQFVTRLARRTQDDIVTVSRDGKDWRDVTNDEPFDRYPRWSPDGKRIAFSSDRKDASQLWISNADGTGLMQFTANPTSEFPTGFPVWSSDGTKLMIHFNGDNLIYSSNSPTAEQQPLVLPRLDNTRRVVIWDWSPDGKLLAGVAAMNDGSYNLVTYSFETNQFDFIMGKFDVAPAWLPDSRHIVYSERHSIMIVDTKTKVARTLISNPKIDTRSPFVSRDGKLVYYVGTSLESDIFLLDLTDKP